MKLKLNDWKSLRNALLALGAALLATALLVTYSGQLAETAAATLKTEQSQLAQARNRLQSSGTEKQNIIQYLPIYQRLITQGIVGEEKREDWIEALRLIQANNKLFSIKYSISKQENYKPDFAVNLGSFALHRSVMKLQLPMLHEGDLLTLLQSLKQEQSAMFMVRDCEIKKLNPLAQIKLNPNSHADCTLDWLTISEAQGVAP
ncbi:MAG: hypothetical protein HOP04_11315 [Methylophilaceae bacterium]|nr:hypothetical protein [Methylophilaceae bacterium]